MKEAKIEDQLGLQHLLKRILRVPSQVLGAPSTLAPRHLVGYVPWESTLPFYDPICELFSRSGRLHSMPTI